VTSDPASSELDDLMRFADHMLLGLLRIDGALTVIAANQAAHLLLERRPGSLIRRSTIEAFVDHRVEEQVRGAMRGTSASGEMTVGRDRELIVRARPATAGGAWVALEDATELHRLQRIRREFIDNLSHELRTPLTTIRLLTELLIGELEGLDVPARVRERVAKIDVETGHLVQMVNELLDLSRMEQAVTQLDIAELLLPALVRGALDRVRTFAERQGVVLVADLSDDDSLPPVQGDEERLGQLLVNLLHNAVKFSPEGSQVAVRATLEGSNVVVSVRDEGPGIPRADLDRIFERFYKVDRARARGVGGTGLGLSIARHIAEGHGGRIWAESADGRGSTFRFSIPVGDTAMARSRT
jgi:two-component system, OmpR family, phosphate regulon sensor histidine kinase PhoR